VGNSLGDAGGSIRRGPTLSTSCVFDLAASRLRSRIRRITESAVKSPGNARGLDKIETRGVPVYPAILGMLLAQRLLRGPREYVTTAAHNI
jgi:hypothetical protein